MATGRARLAFAALLLVVAAALPAAEGPLAPWSGGATPALELKDLDGKPRRLEEFRGKVVLVNFWATWCEPCREELPSLGRLRGQFPGKVEVLAVDAGEGEAKVREFLAKAPVAFPVLMDADSVAMGAWGVRGLPTTYVLDPRGQIRYSFVGQRDWSDDHVKSTVRALLPPDRR